MGFVSLYINWSDDRDRNEVSRSGKPIDGIVKLRFWKTIRYLRNHWDFRLSATVEYLGDTDDPSSIVEKEITLDRRFYIPPAAGKYIRLISYGGKIYDVRMLNRRLEMCISLIIVLIGMALYLSTS